MKQGMADMKRTTHVCLVGGEPVANVTPALDPLFAPEEVVLVTPHRQKHAANWLQAVLEPRGVKVSRWSVGDAYDLGAVRDRIFDLLAEREGQSLALNVTGGTRPMSLAAYEVFRQFDQPVFYIDPRTDDLVWLFHPAYPDGAPKHDLADRIKLGPYMAVHGAHIEATGPAQGVPKALRALCDDLIAHVEALAKPLATLNYLAGTAERSLYSDEMGYGLLKRDDLQALIDRFAAAGCLGRAGDRLVFPDEERRFFVQGGWLEAHVFGTVFGLRKQRPMLQDIGRGVQIARTAGGGDVRNEIDVAFIADNRLFVVECKTACLDRDDAGTVALYKLDSIRAVLDDAHGSAMLVSFRPLRPHQLRRAQELNIQIVSGAELANLESRLASWVPHG